ncbi:DUF11 domain-containing protein [Variovorax sp. PAMC26660]|uniref:DUF11 domain-containing protein n=1 Tax=Variovorax sp. PAMC26660 TaxID=2762322 RepID=UPI0021C4212F|nr:DUF11 domain-containing protein [Variovorax sp. PAMC26660]
MQFLVESPSIRSHRWRGGRAAATVAACVLGFVLSSTGAHAAPAPGGTVIRNVATATYVPAGLLQTETSSSNGVSANVMAVESLLLTQDQAVSRPPASIVTLSHVLTNTGNVPSTYTLGLVNNGAGCPADTLDLSSLRVVRDGNNNGVVDAADPVLPLGVGGALALQPGQGVALLVQGTVPAVAMGSACVALTATTALQNISAVNRDTVNVGDLAVLALTKSASYPGIVEPGNTRIDFSVSGTNIGARDAQPGNTAAPAGTRVTVNNTPTALLLLRDVVPIGTRYIAGTLQSTAAGAVRLFRLQGDAEFSYRTAEDASAIEVAIGVPVALTRNASIAMQFAVQVKADQSGEIRNTAQGFYNDGVAPAVAPSNTVLITTSQSRIGVAKAASAPRMNRGSDGQPDGTATVTFDVNVRNYGSLWLYGVQLPDLMEGSGATQFGNYTTAALPAANQYTVVPGTLAIANSQGNGTAVAVNNAFNGTASGQNLLAPGAVLPVGGQFTVRFDVRFNVAGRASTLYNTVRAQAALAVGALPTIFDDSVNGSNPDADGDGNPNNDASPTPVSTQLPTLSLVKTVSPPRRIAQGVFELDYVLKVSNTGIAPAPNVRLIDNLNCTFDMDKPETHVAAWELTAVPKARNGLLDVAGGFTGRAACNRETLTSADPFKLPTEAALSLTDGARALAPGQSEELSFTVRITQKADAIGSRLALTNKAWAAAFDQNTVNVTPAMLVVASASTAQSLVADPEGTIYNSLTREPVAGAVVTFARQSCRSGPVTPVTPDDLFGGSSGVYTFHANGSASMTTGADGGYQFFLQSPPVTGTCTYTLDVTPPAASGYAFPSQLITVTPGTLDRCGAIVPNGGPPKGSDPTTHYFSLNAGFDASGAACDVVHNHIPLDRGNVLGLVLRKEGSKREVEFGDFMDYALVVTNKTGFPFTGVSLADSLPPGFAYVANSARLNGAVTANPVGGAGPQLLFNFPSLTLAADQSAVLRYRVRIGVGAPTNGDAINRARANSGRMQSNLASWTVRVTGGVFSDDAFLFGKVYMDCKRDGRQEGSDEIGVPGVRLYMEDGTHVVTDVEGKWSLYGLKPITHVLRVDQTTLPLGARLELLDNRNAGRPESRFVDLKKGEFHKANFVVGNCDAPDVMKDVIARRAAIAAIPDTEAEAQVRMRLDPEGRIVPVGDVRSLPASGQALATGSTGASTLATSAPLIAMPSAPAGASGFVNGAAGTMGGTLGASAAPPPTPAGSLFAALNGLPTNAQGASATGGGAAGVGAFASRPVNTNTAMLEPRSSPLLAQAVPSPIELEALLPQIDNNAPGFIDLKDGDTLPGLLVNVRVKGEDGLALRLSVNGKAIEERRVGKKTQLPAKKLGAWEYIGVVLQPGTNRLQLEAVDPFGNVRGTVQQISVIAPDKLGAIQIDVPESAQADLRTPVIVKVRLTDAAGVPVTARTQLTLEADRGRWLDEDLNPAEPGTQVFMDGGVAEFRLLPPGEPGDARIRVTAGSFVKEVRLALMPEMRPMIAVGIVEGVLDFTQRGGVPLGAMPAGAAFESELTGLADEGNKNSRASARTAFFLKGTVKGEYLLTAAYDSNKTRNDRLFRDIRPDEFYPVYGDSSVKGFDAQSTQKLYVRIDKNRSYLLYGDFTTASSTEVRNLSQNNRALTGLKHVYDDGNVRATSFFSRTAQTQQVEEFRAVGTSGPYYLSAKGGEFVDNSEQVEIVVRDRNQPNLVLQRTTVARFVDYTIEPLTRRLLFTHAIASADANLNPQSIRVTYEVDAGGPKFNVAGTDVQVKVTDNLQLGVVASTDENPENRRKLGAVTAVARVGDNTTMAGEWVRTESDKNGKGNGGRIELRHQTADLAVVALASKTSTGFDNPGASFSAGRTEASARAEYRIDSTTALRGEAIYSQDALLEGSRRGFTASVQKKFGDQLVGEVGLRHGQSGAGLGSSSGFDYGQISTYSGNLGSGVGASNVTALGGAANANAHAEELTTLRARVSAQMPGLPQANVFVEGEQDIRKSDRHVLAVGGNYAVTDKTRIYGRYELVSSLYGPDELTSSSSNNVGILGIESSYMEGGRVYSEYRLADSLDGRAAQAATGVRNTFKISEGLSVTGGIEHTRQLGGYRNSGNSGTGYSGGLGQSTAITGGLEYITERMKTSGVLEARHGDDANTRLFSAGFGYKLDRSWSLLARSVMSDSEGQGTNAGNERHLSRHQIGLAYRPVDTDSWNALMRYERRSERVVGTGSSTGALDGGSVFGSGYGNASLPGTTSADIVSAHFNYNPRPGTVVNGRYAAKWSRADDGLLKSTYWAHLLQARYTQDINKDWDFGVQAGLLYGKDGALQKTVGVEVGYQVMKDLWVSAGYNFVGLKDRDLTANEYTSKGAYIRLRFKFDETGLGFPSAGAQRQAKGRAGDAAPVTADDKK